MPLSRRSALKGMLVTAVGAATGAGVYGSRYERHHLSVTRATLPVRGLPEGFDGIRVALLTDIHHSSLVSADDVSRAVTMTNALEPDLIVLGGDYVTAADRAFMEPVAELLAPLRAPLGVLAILGNHDDDHDMPAALSRQHLTVLKDQRLRLDHRGDSLDIVGIRFWTQRPSDVAKLLRVPASTLLLAHDPRRVVEAAALGVPGLLSGHTHGGQIVIPGLGALAARKFPLAEGIGRRGNSTVFVSRGLGTVYLPVRINCPPEIALLTLRRPPNGELPGDIGAV